MEVALKSTAPVGVIGESLGSSGRVRPARSVWAARALSVSAKVVQAPRRACRACARSRAMVRLALGHGSHAKRRQAGFSLGSCRRWVERVNPQFGSFRLKRRVAEMAAFAPVVPAVGAHGVKGQAKLLLVALGAGFATVAACQVQCASKFALSALGAGRPPLGRLQYSARMPSTASACATSKSFTLRYPANRFIERTKNGVPFFAAHVGR